MKLLHRSYQRRGCVGEVVKKHLKVLRAVALEHAQHVTAGGLEGGVTFRFAVADDLDDALPPVLQAEAVRPVTREDVELNEAVAVGEPLDPLPRGELPRADERVDLGK